MGDGWLDPAVMAACYQVCVRLAYPDVHPRGASSVRSWPRCGRPNQRVTDRRGRLLVREEQIRAGVAGDGEDASQPLAPIRPGQGASERPILNVRIQARVQSARLECQRDDTQARNGNA